MSTTAVTVTALRGAVAARLEGYQSLRESPELFEFRSLRSPVHLAFFVGVPSSEPMTDRQKASVGVLTRTEIQIVVQYQIATKDRVVGFAALLDLERLINNRIMEQSASWPILAPFIWRGTTRSALQADGWMESVARFDTVHLHPLLPPV